MKILLFPSVVRSAIEARIEGMQSLQVQPVKDENEANLLMPDADAMVMPAHCYTDQIAEWMKTQGRRIQFIQLLSSGYEELETRWTPAGLVIASAGGIWASPVAEHAMALILTLTRRMPEILDSQRRHVWNQEIRARMQSLDGRTLLIVGYGNIGRAVARRARAFGMRIIGVSRSVAPTAAEHDIVPTSSLLSVLGQADIVLVAVPSTNDTAGLIGAEALAACKPGSIIINIARGAVIDTNALQGALVSGHLGGAALDVTDPEPLPEDHALWAAPNVVISPHVAIGGAEQVIERLADLTVENLLRFSRGERVSNSIAVKGKAPVQKM